MRKKQAYKLIIFIFCFVAYSILLINIPKTTTSKIVTAEDKELARFIENYSILKENWYYYSSDKEVIDAATNAMSESSKSDKYTMYIPSDLSDEYLSSMESNYVGIGIQYVAYSSYPIVTKVFDNSPALSVGMQSGDMIVSVDGKDIKDLKTDKIREMVVGKADTKVKIGLQRGQEKLELELTRKPIESSIAYHIEDGIGFLKINQFSETTAKEAKVALDYFKEEKISKVVIDLRDNPGGYLTSVVDVADLFLGKNEIVLSSKDAKGKKEDYKTSTSEKMDFDLKILINKNTASAGEVLTAALNELLDVETYGETTFGKGIMQTHFTYKDKAMMKYTNAAWLTPKGNEINEVGIKPTIPVSKSAIFENIELNFDTKKAIKFDTVNSKLVNYQKALKSLGYDIDREDGYYSQKTQEVITKFKTDHNLSDEVDLSINVQVAIIQQLYINSNDVKEDLVLEKVIKDFK